MPPHSGLPATAWPTPVPRPALYCRWDGTLPPPSLAEDAQESRVRPSGARLAEVRTAAPALAGLVLLASCSSTRRGTSRQASRLPGGLGAGKWLLQRNGQTLKGSTLSETPVFVAADPGTYEVFIICTGAETTGTSRWSCFTASPRPWRCLAARRRHRTGSSTSGIGITTRRGERRASRPSRTEGVAGEHAAIASPPSLYRPGYMRCLWRHASLRHGCGTALGALGRPRVEARPATVVAAIRAEDLPGEGHHVRRLSPSVVGPRVGHRLGSGRCDVAHVGGTSRGTTRPRVRTVDVVSARPGARLSEGYPSGMPVRRLPSVQRRRIRRSHGSGTISAAARVAFNLKKWSGKRRSGGAWTRGTRRSSMGCLVLHDQRVPHRSTRCARSVLRWRLAGQDRARRATGHVRSCR